MQSNKLRMAIRSTAAVAILGVASQVNAVELDTGDVTTNLYGFARVAASYDIDENIATGGQSGSFASITGGDNEPEGHFGMDANTSRLGLSVVSPEGVKGVVEFDFDRDDSLTPRLRLAYGEYNGLMVGQNWTNFLSFNGNTSTLDFDSLPGTGGAVGRTPQIRYTTGPFSFSAEQEIANVVAGTGGTARTDTKQGLPVFTARLQDSQGGLSYAAAVLARQIMVDDGTNDDSAMGYGMFVSARFAVSDMVTLQGALNYTDGAAAYVYRTGNNGFWGYDAYTDTSGDLETVESTGASIGAKFDLGGNRSVNIGYGMAQQDLDDGVAAGSIAGSDAETNSMATLNYQWKPASSINMGVEYARLETENQNGSDGEANRLMFLAQYSF